MRSVRRPCSDMACPQTTASPSRRRRRCWSTQVLVLRSGSEHTCRMWLKSDGSKHSRARTTQHDVSLLVRIRHPFGIPSSLSADDGSASRLDLQHCHQNGACQWRLARLLPVTSHKCRTD